jgi:DNA-3-methyladenine glycosylase I
MTAADGRCHWCGDDPLYVAYHDDEWGRPIRNDRTLFALLMLEGFQAGLSWITILRKREAFARAFDDWRPETIAAYGDADRARLLADAGIVRNRLKIDGAVRNARAWLALQEANGSFADWVWQFAPPPDRPAPRTPADVPARTAESDALSRALKQAGFTFVGSTIVYAFMQSAGLVNDHLAGCPARDAGR